MITKLLSHNPFRILGVYSNSPKKDVLSNLNKMKAFLKVGKTMSFPMDLPTYLRSVTRDEAIVSSAQAAIELPMDQMKHTLFWFMKATPVDDIAFNHLLSGNLALAKDIWGKKDSVSSLLNLMACSMIKGDGMALAQYADTLFQNHTDELCTAVNGTIKLTSSQLTELFVELLKKDGSFDIAKMMRAPGTSSEWKQITGRSIVKPIIDKITLAIAEAKNAKGATANYCAGIKLMDSTKELLSQLENLLGISDIQYQMTADKLAGTILQCGINYYNDSGEDDSATKAMILQQYALSIAVGQVVKDRCQENYNILKKNISELPPIAVRAEAKAVRNELAKFCKLPDKISHSIELLNNTKAPLQAIKQKLGATDAYYLNISTQVVGNALHNIIEEVNNAQNYDPEVGMKELMKQYGLFDTYTGMMQRQRENAALRLKLVKSALKEAWTAIRIIDGFDMEKSFYDERYMTNRKTLLKLCNQVGIKTKTLKEKLEPWAFALIPFIAIEIIIFIIASNNCLHEDDAWLWLLVPLMPLPFPVIIATIYVCGYLGQFLWKFTGKAPDMYDIV